MKIVFNFKIGRTRTRVARTMVALAVALLSVFSLGAAPARAETIYFSTADLLRDFFRDSKAVTYKKLDVGPESRARLVRRLGYAPARASYTFFVATSAGTDGRARIDGYALIDEQMGEHQPITFAVKLSPNGVVERQEIVCYREPRGDEVRDPRFRKQFVGKTAQDPVAADEDIVAVSGATISSRAMALGVKRALVLFDELVRDKVVTASASPGAARPAGL
jgi:hypothetical protein